MSFLPPVRCLGQLGINFFVSVCLASVCAGQSDNPQTQAVRKSINALIDTFEARNHFSGVVIVEKNGERIVERCCGFADQSHERKNTIDSQFCIASIAKSMTRAIGIRLLEQFSGIIRPFVQIRPRISE